MHRYCSVPSQSSGRVDRWAALIGQQARPDGDELYALQFERFDPLGAAARDVAPHSQRPGDFLMRLSVSPEATSDEVNAADVLMEAARLECVPALHNFVHCSGSCAVDERSLQVILSKAAELLTVCDWDPGERGGCDAGRRLRDGADFCAADRTDVDGHPASGFLESGLPTDGVSSPSN